MQSKNGQHLGRKYVIIMPSRDEARFIERTIACLARQTIPPEECVIVDDGSTDATGRIADKAAAEYPWLQVVHRPNRGARAVGGGVIEAFYSGFEVLRRDDYDYICKMDADITLRPDYFQRIIEKMEGDPQLGAASGKVFNPTKGEPFEERIIDEQVSGAAKFYRREAFEQIGGFVQAVMWDGIDFHRARMLGWKTRSFRDDELKIMHYRLMGSSHRNVFHGRLRWGRGQWFMGTHPLYILASGIYRFAERPWVVGGLFIIMGYFDAMLRKQARYDDIWFRRNLHCWQLNRIGLGWFAPRTDE